MASAYTLGPYSVFETDAAIFRVMGQDGIRVCVTDNRADAERIAYCLTVVEQSEETARRDEGVVGDNDRLRIGASSIGDQRPKYAELISEYVAAYRARNTMNDPPEITYAGGWFTFKSPGLPPRKYRRHAVEAMRDNLRRQAGAQS